VSENNSPFQEQPRAFIVTATLHKFELCILWSYEFLCPLKKWQVEEIVKLRSGRKEVQQLVKQSVWSGGRVTAWK